MDTECAPPPATFLTNRSLLAVLAAQMNLSLRAEDFLSFSNSSFISQEAPPSEYRTAEKVLLGGAMVGVCCCGVLGNLLLLSVLVHRRWKQLTRRGGSGDNRAAVCDIASLGALAAADVLFCAAVLPHAAVDVDRNVFPGGSFMLYYTLYQNAVINTFVMLITWLTVAMTMSRYFNLCHPLWALGHFGPRYTGVSIATCVTFSVLFNVPRYLALRPVLRCTLRSGDPGYEVVIPDPPPAWQAAYHWAYFVCGILLPLLLLAYCNSRIIHAVCHSSFGERRRQERHVVTRTLIVLVLLYLILVSPGEIVKFFGAPLASHSAAHDLTVAVVNSLQAINFSFSFIPYLVLDKTFRGALWRTLSCSQEKRLAHSGHVLRGEGNSSSTYNSQSHGSSRITTTRLLED